MLDLALDADSLMFENAVLARALGDSQRRCADALARGAQQIRRLEAQVLRLRAEVILRTTAMAWGREPVGVPPDETRHSDARERAEDHSPAQLEASLRAADLVICQTGCLSHGAYWRVQDHCRRTGKLCVMVDQAHAISFVRGERVNVGYAVELGAIDVLENP